MVTYQRKNQLEQLLNEAATEMGLEFTLIEVPPETTGLKHPQYEVRWRKDASQPWIDCFPVHRFGTSLAKNSAISAFKAWRLGYRTKEMLS